MQRAKNRTMNVEGLVLGALDISGEISDPLVAEKYRDFTIAWSRYDYRGEIIETTTVNEMLDQAANHDYRWCLILPYGHIIAERWTPEHWQAEDFFSVLAVIIDQADFFVAGAIVGDEKTWFGFEHRCVLVNLELYQQFSSPNFDLACSQPIEVPRVERRTNQDRISSLLSTDATDMQQPRLLGWNFISTSLRHGVPVAGFDERLLAGVLDLSAKRPARTKAFAKFLNSGIVNYCQSNDVNDLSNNQIAFLNVVKPQTTSARNGVFLWNIEAYTDIDNPSEDFNPPISSLYSVAAGFKPNRILHTHGFDERTRVVYFDYSRKALDVKKYMVELWDGKDFTSFVEQLFRAFPYPETFYQLWDGLTPENVSLSDIHGMWQRELERWGGDQKFLEHWQMYRELPHEYVCCNILTDPSPLLEQLADESDAIIWWSNAFFTMYGNWFYTLDQRRQMYEQWIRQIARRNPDLFLFGSDYNNVNVNCVQSTDYWYAYQRSGGNCLIPFRSSKTEIRM